MTDEPDDTLELEPDMELEEEQEEAPEPEGEEEFSFDGEPEDTSEPTQLVKHLRTVASNANRELRTLRQQLAARQPEEQPIVVGARPRLYDDGIDGDEEKLDKALDAYDERRAAADEQKRKGDEAKRRQADDWGKVQARYADEKAKIAVAGRDEAEATALAELSPQQQAVIARHADNPARFIIALGKNPAQLAAIASLEDPFALTKAMTKMEATLKSKRTIRPPEPDTPVRGRPVASSNVDKQLEKLEAEAAKTGNRDKIIAFKRAQKEKAK